MSGHTHTGYALINHNHANYAATSTVSSLQSEIDSLKTSVSNGKSAVASAITDMGISTSATASFNTLASNIRSISTTPRILFTMSLPYGTTTLPKAVKYLIAEVSGEGNITLSLNGGDTTLWSATAANMTGVGYTSVVAKLQSSTTLFANKYISGNGPSSTPPPINIVGYG